MKTRGYFATVINLFVFTSLPFSILMAIFSGTPIGSTLIPGVVFGLIFGFIGALFLKGDKITIPLDNKDKTISKVNIRLAEIGYHPETQTENFLTFKPSFQAGLLAGKISIQVEVNSLTIIGPRIYLKKLIKEVSG